MIEIRGRKYDPTENFFKPEKLKGLSGANPSMVMARGRKTYKPKPRQRIKPISKKRAKKNQAYEKAKREWRKERKETDNFQCEYEDKGVRCTSRADHNPHHRKRRQGSLLCDRRWFMAVCLPHHRHIEDHPAEAKEKGYLIYDFKAEKVDS